MRFKGLSAGTREHFRRDGLAKVAFPSQADAETDAPATQVAYLCRFCKLWHRGNVT